MPEAIACRGVTKTYPSASGAVEALHSLDASFAAGTIGALVGPSGCGKSTLLRLIGGLDGADTGTIEVAGVDVTALHGHALRRYRRGTVAFLAQRAVANLVPHLTVREQLGRRLDAALAAELGLAARLDARAEQLSGGEQARAALAVALTRDTPVLLADEPTAELDRENAAHVVDALRRTADAGRTVLVATHDPELVAAASAAVELAGAAGASTQARASPQPTGPPVLEIRGLTKRYDGAPVVDDVSLELRPGELGVLLGRSGSGKSTLLMAAGAWLRPDSGAVVRPGDGWTETAYVAQRFGLLPELSVAENVGLPFRLGRRRDEGRVASLLAELGLASLAGRTPAETSVGQQQRVAVARALAVRPAVVLADEPTSHQDTGSAELVWAALAAACRAGAACLVATHDERAAARADRLWHIADGRVRAVD